MLKALKEILSENWQWRSQIANLGIFDLRKQAGGAALGWFWFFAKPAVYVAVFWFALEIGLRQGEATDGPPYILWLIGGLVPWFYMQEILGQGSDVLHRFPYLVNKIRFPLSGIPSLYGISNMVVQLGLVALLLVIYFAFGLPFDLYLLQIPFAMVVMYVFWNMFSLMTSMLSAVSKDFKNLVKTLSTPLFWLSGIIFDVYALGIDWIQGILMFDPVTFICTMYRGAVYDKTWIWENTDACLGMLVVFLVTLVAMLVVYKRVKEEVYDVL